MINMDYVRLSTDLYTHHVRLSRNLYVRYVRLSTSLKLETIGDLPRCRAKLLLDPDRFCGVAKDI